MSIINGYISLSYVSPFLGGNINLFDLGLLPSKGLFYYFDQLHFAEILKFL